MTSREGPDPRSPARSGSSAASPPPCPSSPPDPERPPERPPGRLRPRTVLLGLLFLSLVGCGVDLLRPPERQLSARLLLGAIDGYQSRVSPTLAATGVSCRFEPTCSRYAEGAIAEDGALRGSARAAWRILRCGPWTPAGTVDPP